MLLIIFLGIETKRNDRKRKENQKEKHNLLSKQKLKKRKLIESTNLSTKLRFFFQIKTLKFCLCHFLHTIKSKEEEKNTRKEFNRTAAVFFLVFTIK